MRYSSILLICLILSNCNKRLCVIEKYESGQIASEICYDSDKRKNGAYKEYHDNGNIIFKASYCRDSLDGLVIKYHKNSKIWYSAIYRMNRLVIIHNMYDERGGNLDFGSVLNGNGIVKTYSASGKLRSYGPYEDGLKHGYWVLVGNGGPVDSVLFEHGRRTAQDRLEVLP